MTNTSIGQLRVNLLVKINKVALNLETTTEEQKKHDMSVTLDTLVNFGIENGLIHQTELKRWQDTSKLLA